MQHEVQLIGYMSDLLSEVSHRIFHAFGGIVCHLYGLVGLTHHGAHIDDGAFTLLQVGQCSLHPELQR